MSDQDEDLPVGGDLGIALAARVRPRLGVRDGTRRGVGRVMRAARSFSRSMGVPLSLRADEGVPVGLPSVQGAAMAPPEYWLQAELSRPADAADADIARIREWRDRGRVTPPPRRGLPMAMRRRGGTSMGADTAPGRASRRFGGVAAPTPAAEIAQGTRAPRRPAAPSREQLWPTPGPTPAVRSDPDPGPVGRQTSTFRSTSPTVSPAPTRDELWPRSAAAPNPAPGPTAPPAGRAGAGASSQSSTPASARPASLLLATAPSPAPGPARRGVGRPAAGAAPVRDTRPGTIGRRTRDAVAAAVSVPVTPRSATTPSFAGEVAMATGIARSDPGIRLALPVVDGTTTMRRSPATASRPEADVASPVVAESGTVRPPPVVGARRPDLTRAPATAPSATAAATAVPVALVPRPVLGTTAARPHPFGLRPNGSRVIAPVPPPAAALTRGVSGTTGGRPGAGIGAALPATPRAPGAVAPTGGTWPTVPDRSHPVDRGVAGSPPAASRSVASPAAMSPAADRSAGTSSPAAAARARSVPSLAPSTPGVLVRRSQALGSAVPVARRRSSSPRPTTGRDEPATTPGDHGLAPAGSAPHPDTPVVGPRRSRVAPAASRMSRLSGTDGLRVGGAPLPPSPASETARPAPSPAPTAADLRARLESSSGAGRSGSPSSGPAGTASNGTGKVGGASGGDGPAIVRRFTGGSNGSGGGGSPVEAGTSSVVRDSDEFDHAPRRLTRADAEFLLREVERMVRREVERRGHHHRGGRP